MAMISRHRKLADRLPADVRERTTRAGASDIDWYAGRPSVTPQARTGISTTPREDSERLRKLAGEHRRARKERTGGRASAVASLVASMRRLAGRVLHGPRAAGP